MPTAPRITGVKRHALVTVLRSAWMALVLFVSMAEDSNRWVTRTRGSVAKIQKKRKSIEKSYLDVLYGSRNTRNRSSILEILLLVLKNIIQLHLSFEIDLFEVEVLDLL